MKKIFRSIWSGIKLIGNIIWLICLMLVYVVWTFFQKEDPDCTNDYDDIEG